MLHNLWWEKQGSTTLTGIVRKPKKLAASTSSETFKNLLNSSLKVGGAKI